MNLKTLFTVLYRLGVSHIFPCEDYFPVPACPVLGCRHWAAHPASAGLRDKTQELGVQLRCISHPENSHTWKLNCEQNSFLPLTLSSPPLT